MATRRTTTRTVPQLRAEAYRAAIRSAAERVIAKHGFAGARVQQIAAEAGMSVGTVYRVYAGKKAEIYHDIHVHHGTAVIGRGRGVGTAVFEQGGDVLDAILAGTGAYIEYFLEHPDFLRIVLREEKAWAQGPSRQTAAQTAMWNEGTGGMEDGFRLGIATGLFVDETPSVMVRTIVAIQQAHLWCWLEGGGNERPSEMIARLNRQLVHALCRPEVLPERLARLTRSHDRVGDTGGKTK